MAKPRFVVLQMKDIIRTGVFVLLGLVLLIVLIWAVMPRNEPAAGMGLGAFVPGTYTSYIIIHNQPIAVSVTVSEDEIIDIALSELAQTQEVFYPLIRPTMAALSQQILTAQNTNIESPIETAVTSRILLDAINNALLQAAQHPEN